MNSAPLAKNPAQVYRRLLQNTGNNLAIALNCSALIDVLNIDLYNERMANDTIQTLIAMEMADPERKLNRSEGALYLVLSALILVVISIGNLLFSRWQIPRYLVHLPLYTLIAIACLYIYRRHYLSFRYTLTDQTFAVERVAGNSDRSLVAVPLADINYLAAYTHAARSKLPIVNASVRKKRESILIVTRFEGEAIALIISPSEDFLTKLSAQRETAVLCGKRIEQTNGSTPEDTME